MPNGMAPPLLSRGRGFTLAAIPPCRQGSGRRAIGSEGLGAQLLFDA